MILYQLHLPNVSGRQSDREATAHILSIYFKFSSRRRPPKASLRRLLLPLRWSVSVALQASTTRQYVDRRFPVISSSLTRWEGATGQRRLQRKVHPCRRDWSMTGADEGASHTTSTADQARPEVPPPDNAMPPETEREGPAAADLSQGLSC